MELTTVDEWNYVKKSDKPADASTRGLSAISLRESTWLKRPSFLRTHDWPFKPPNEVEIKLKAKKSDTPHWQQEISEFLTALSATVIGIATTFDGQKYSSYEKLLRVVAYILSLLQKHEGYRSDSGLTTDSNEMQNAEMRLFHLIQQGSFPVETKCLKPP